MTETEPVPTTDESGSIPLEDWRIDELAQRAGVAVDTIRYYQREGLLPAARPAGRTRRYSQEHLERLERIRALQSRRFSLAAIHALLAADEGPASLEGLLAGSDDTTYDRSELVDAAGLPTAFLDLLTEAGLLLDPSEHGRSAYDLDDLRVLRSFADLRRAAVPDAILVEVARVYAEGLDVVSRHVAAVFEGADGPGWQEGDRDRFHHEVYRDSTQFARAIRVIADYTQQRNLQRVVLHALEQRAAEHAAKSR